MTKKVKRNAITEYKAAMSESALRGRPLVIMPPYKGKAKKAVSRKGK